jgi:hypothetical protein
MNWTIVDALVFHGQLAARIHHGNRDGGLMNVHADILFLTHKALLSLGWCANNLNLPQKWALFYIA